MSPILSVIVPILNCKEYQRDEIREGMESILNQQMDGNMEILVLHRNNNGEIQKLLADFSENCSERVQLSEIPTDMSMLEILEYGSALAMGKYIVCFDYVNRWEANSLNYAIAQMEQAGDVSALCLCNESYQRKTSAKSTFRYMYKKGDTSVDVRENPRYVAVSLNNVVMRTEAFCEAVQKSTDVIYGWDLLILTELAQKYPNIQISASTKFIYRNSERLCGLQSRGGAQYLTDTKELMNALQTISTGNLQEYIWNMKLYVMRQYIEGVDSEADISEVKDAYEALLRRELQQIPDDVIDKAPGTVQMQRLVLYTLKYGMSVLDEATVKEGKVSYQNHRLINLKRDAFRISTMEWNGGRISEDHLHVTGSIAMWGAHQLGNLKVTASDGAEYPVTLAEYPERAVRNRFDEIILPGWQFCVDVPVRENRTLEFIAEYGGETVKLQPKLESDVRLKDNHSNSFYSEHGWLIRYNKGEITLLKDTLLQRVKCKRKYEKELKKSGNSKSLKNWRRECKWRKQIRKLPLQNQVAFVTPRSNTELLPNMQQVYDVLEGKKVIFTHMMPYDEETMEEAIRTVYSSKVVVTDDYFYLLRKFGKRPGQKVVQLWHACGAFKKFGQQGTSMFPAVDHLYHRDYDLVSVSSESVREIYANAFDIPIARVQPLGVPRTDLLLSQDYQNEVRQRIEERYPNFQGKQIILYAPTLRDRDGTDKHEFHPEINFDTLSEVLGKKRILVICPHPVMQNDICGKRYDNIIQMEEFSTNEVMCISDLLITDYSSVIFEYALLGKPMVFYCYDYGEYNRDFYLDYENELPGALIRDFDSLIDYLGKERFEENVEVDRAFQEIYMAACDGNSSERIAVEIKKMLNE